MNQIFTGKSGFVTLCPLLSWNFMPSFRKILWRFLIKTPDRRTDGRTNEHGSIYRTNLLCRWVQKLLFRQKHRNQAIFGEHFLCPLQSIIESCAYLDRKDFSTRGFKRVEQHVQIICSDPIPITVAHSESWSFSVLNTFHIFVQIAPSVNYFVLSLGIKIINVALIIAARTLVTWWKLKE